MIRRFVVAVCLSVAAAVLSPALRAAEILIAGTGGSPPVTQSSFVGLLSGGNTYATSFSVPVGPSYALAHLQLAAFHYTGNGGSAIFTISANAAGLPGSALETFNVSTVEALTEATAGFTVAPASPLILNGGQKYWITGRSTSGQVNWVHGFGAFGETAFSNGTSWQLSPGSNLPAFAVLGDAVPEPGTVVLVAIALGAMWLPRRGGSLGR